MTIEKSVLGIVPGLQATALVGHNLNAMNFGINKKKSKNSKNFSMKKMTKLGVTNILGVGLIGATATEINKLP